MPDRHYCTLFNLNYAAKGLSLHASLLRHSSEPFTLHILAMDEATFWLLSELKLESVNVIPLHNFESAMNMRAVKASRSLLEYFWTAASNLMEFLLCTGLDGVTYLDADVFFYADPKVIFDEVGEKSIGITPHRFAERDVRRLGRNGTYNVGVVVARNTFLGLQCISRWAKQCREWCFNRNEAGKFGDQAYLDSWPKDYPEEVFVIENLGVNLGPWAIGNVEVTRFLGSVSLMAPVVGPIDIRVQEYPLVCYHFHEFVDSEHLTNWPLRPEDKELIYASYIAECRRSLERIDLAKEKIQDRWVAMEAEGLRA